MSFDDLFMYPSLASNGSLTLHLTLLGGGGGGQPSFFFMMFLVAKLAIINMQIKKSGDHIGRFSQIWLQTKYETNCVLVTHRKPSIKMWRFLLFSFLTFW